MIARHRTVSRTRPMIIRGGDDSHQACIMHFQVWGKLLNERDDLQRKTWTCPTCKTQVYHANPICTACDRRPSPTRSSNAWLTHNPPTVHVTPAQRGP
jgi:hypothetical protein